MPANACTQFCDDLADLVFSGQSKESVIEKATLMLRLILEVPPTEINVPTDGFRAELLDRNQFFLGRRQENPVGDIKHPANYSAGEEVGQAIGQALNGKIDKATLRKRLRTTLCQG